MIEHQLPQIATLVAKGTLQIENVDVFCEKGVFDVDQTRRILQAARNFGFKINFHGEELCQLKSPEVSIYYIGTFTNTNILYQNDSSLTNL